MKGLFITLQGTVNNSNLPILNRISLPITKMGTGVGVSRIKLGTIVDETNKVKLTFKNSIAKFYSDQACTVLLGTTVEIYSNGNATYYVKTTADDELLIDNSQSISALGHRDLVDSSDKSLWISYDANAPKLTFDFRLIKYLFNLKRISFQPSPLGSNIVILNYDASLLHYSAKLKAYINLMFSDINPPLTDYNAFLIASQELNALNMNTAIIADLNNLNFNTALQLSVDLQTTTNVLTYTGTTAKNWGIVNAFSVKSSSMPAAQVDNLLISLANSATGTGLKIIIVIGAARTAASDAAIATLQGKGFTVTTNSL